MCKAVGWEEVAAGRMLKVCRAVGRETVHSRLGAARKVAQLRLTVEMKSSPTRARKSRVALIDSRLPKDERMFHPVRAVG